MQLKLVEENTLFGNYNTQFLFWCKLFKQAGKMDM